MRKQSELPSGHKVGYGRPPKHSQFRPGQSGNPSGRPKKRHTLTSFVGQILNEKLSIVENGEEKRVSKLEALARSMIAKAIKGEGKAMGQLLSLLSQSDELQQQLVRHVIEWEFVDAIDGRPSQKGKN